MAAFFREVGAVGAIAGVVAAAVGWSGAVEAGSEGASLRSRACERKVVNSGVIQAVTQSLGGTTCATTIDHNQLETLVYRDYLFDNEGIFMVFESVEGPEATSTGARAFFLFPRKLVPSFTVLSSGDVSVTSTTGTTFVFSKDDARLKSSSDFQFKEDPDVSMTNDGGVEILGHSGIVLDTGWRVGNMPYVDKNRTSAFSDPHGATCEVSNPEIFTYPGDPQFKFKNDYQLRTFLQFRCPNLDLVSLWY